MFKHIINWLNNPSAKAPAQSCSLRTLSAREVHAIAGGATISYGALQRNNNTGSTKQSTPANSYTRGCSAAQRCRS